MIGVVIVTHADFGQGILNAIKLIAGEQAGVRTIGLNHGDGIYDFEKKVMDSINELDTGNGVIGLCDFLGGSPSNVMLRCMKNKKFPCIVGVNMPMALEAIMNRYNVDVWELAKICHRAGISNILDLHMMTDDMKKENDDKELEDF